MSILQASILGIVQGLTEFLPISSSGHLLFMQHFLGLKNPQLTFDIAVHFGTLCAIMIFFRKKIYQIFSGLNPLNPQQNPEARISYFIILGSVPTALIGFLIKSKCLSVLNSLTFAAVMLLVTGTLLYASKGVQGSTSHSRDIMGWNTYHALLVGTMQGLSVLPGLSRSGTTITTAMLAGSSRETAFEFSFLLSIPAILGANLLQLRDVRVAISSGNVLSVAVGVLIAFGVGWLALSALKWVVNQAKLHIFAWYCWALGTVILLDKAILG